MRYATNGGAGGLLLWTHALASEATALLLFGLLVNLCSGAYNTAACPEVFALPALPRNRARHLGIRAPVGRSRCSCEQRLDGFSGRIDVAGSTV